MKKILQLVALIAVAALLLCGCVDAADPGNTGTGTQSEPSGTQETTTAPTETDPVDDGKVAYTVTVVDQDGNPVKGVSVQFCDENSKCLMPVKTDEQGKVTKSLEPMVYHVTLTLPEGYSCDVLEYNLEDVTELTVTVTAG